MKEIIKRLVRNLLTRSLRASNRERGEFFLKKRLICLVPDIVHQYSRSQIQPEDVYLNENCRCQHAFQMSLAMAGIALLKKNENTTLSIIDIGDSSGTHMIYLNGLARTEGLKVKTLSINLDSEAIRKIESKGLQAVQCRAEELHRMGIHPDLFISFEMLEHLFDPITFLHTIAVSTSCEYFVLSVPYVTRSRVGFHQLRHEYADLIYAENTHIFELCPEDWNLLFLFSGWDVILADRYTQYPKRGLLHWTKYLWRKLDFDGFYGVVLRKNLEKARKYQDWPSI